MDADSWFIPGDLVFAKVRGYPPWPARVEQEAPKGVKVPKETYPVFFFGSHDMAVLGTKYLFPYEPNKQKLGGQKPGTQKIAKVFNSGIWEIEHTPTFKPESQLQKTADVGLLPSCFIKIRKLKFEREINIVHDSEHVLGSIIKEEGKIIGVKLEKIKLLGKYSIPSHENTRLLSVVDVSLPGNQNFQDIQNEKDLPKVCDDSTNSEFITRNLVDGFYVSNNSCMDSVVSTSCKNSINSKRQRTEVPSFGPTSHLFCRMGKRLNFNNEEDSARKKFKLELEKKDEEIKKLKKNCSDFKKQIEENKKYIKKVEAECNNAEILGRHHYVRCDFHLTNLETYRTQNLDLIERTKKLESEKEKYILKIKKLEHVTGNNTLEKSKTQFTDASTQTVKRRKKNLAKPLLSQTLPEISTPKFQEKMGETRKNSINAEEQCGAEREELQTRTEGCPLPIPESDKPPKQIYFVKKHLEIYKQKELDRE